MNQPHHRIARPVSDPEDMAQRYCNGLGMRILGSFHDHAGFDGVMVGMEGGNFHFEFTRCREHPVKPAPTVEDLLVFYVPDESEWAALSTRLKEAGFKQVGAFNPYWEENGITFEDPDGYRTVLARQDWVNVAKAH